MEIKLSKEKILSKSELVLIIAGFLLFFVFLYFIKEALSPLLLAATIILMLLPLIKYKVVKILLITVSSLFVFWLASGMMSLLQPFIVGIIIAYVLNPLIHIMEKKINRSIAVLITLLLVLGILAVTLLLIIPKLISSLEKFLSYDSMIQIKNNITNSIYPYLNKFGLNKAEIRQIWEIHVAPGLLKIFSDLKSGIGNIGYILVAIFQRILYIFILPFFIYYIMVDWNKFLKFIHDLFPLNKQARFEYYFDKINKTFNSYLRGLIIIAALNSFDVSILLLIFGFDYPILVGLISGLFTFIPQFGIIISIIINIMICYMGNNPGTYIPIVLAVLIGHNLLEAALITPKLVGKKINVHPALLIISIFVFAFLFGFVGLFIAAPATAIIVSIIKEWKAEKREIEESRNILSQ
ncbi:MAG TPA: AI-2E family transporter [Bacteroidota bacterium]|nr:AI-2E family transporter [Bacteroidota bacterium]